MKVFLDKITDRIPIGAYRFTAYLIWFNLVLILATTYFFGNYSYDAIQTIKHLGITRIVSFTLSILLLYKTYKVNFNTTTPLAFIVLITILGYSSTSIWYLIETNEMYYYSLGYGFSAFVLIGYIIPSMVLLIISQRLPNLNKVRYATSILAFCYLITLMANIVTYSFIPPIDQVNIVQFTIQGGPFPFLSIIYAIQLIATIGICFVVPKYLLNIQKNTFDEINKVNSKANKTKAFILVGGIVAAIFLTSIISQKSKGEVYPNNTNRYIDNDSIRIETTIINTTSNRARVGLFYVRMKEEKPTSENEIRSTVELAKNRLIGSVSSPNGKYSTYFEGYIDDRASVLEYTFQAPIEEFVQSNDSIKLVFSLPNMIRIDTLPDKIKINYKYLDSTGSYLKLQDFFKDYPSYRVSVFVHPPN